MAVAPSKAKKKPGQGTDVGGTPRRKFVWYVVFGWIGVCTLATIKFFFPRVLFEPKTRFRIGFPSDYTIGVDTKWQPSQRIWVVREVGKLYVILAKCTHLGCTPDWKETENKFKCPCHGSGFDSEGVNFEGPAPRPLERVLVKLDAEGQIEVDKARTFKQEDWEKPEAFITV